MTLPKPQIQVAAILESPEVGRDDAALSVSIPVQAIRLPQRLIIAPIRMPCHRVRLITFTAQDCRSDLRSGAVGPPDARHRPSSLVQPPIRELRHHHDLNQIRVLKPSLSSRLLLCHLGVTDDIGRHHYPPPLCKSMRWHVITGK